MHFGMPILRTFSWSTIIFFTFCALNFGAIWEMLNCQAKVQVQVQSLKSKFKVKSKVFKSKRTWTLLTVLSKSPPPPENFSNHFQRSYSQVLYLFGNLSWPSTRIASHLQISAKYFATHFCKERKWDLKERKSQISFAWPSRLQSSWAFSLSIVVLQFIDIKNQERWQ